MRSLPVFLLSTFGPTPKGTLSYRAWFIGPNVFMNVHAVFVADVDHRLHFVEITRQARLSIDFSDNVFSGDATLPHSHVAHLGTGEVSAVARRINSLMIN